MNTLAHAPLQAQMAFVVDCVKRNAEVYRVLERAATLDLPNWYVGGGCVVQTVWNVCVERPLTENIKDIDLIYFAPDEVDDVLGERAEQTLSEITALPLDIKNQALVHTWYSRRFGYEIPPYTSTEHAISTWPTTTASLGLRLTQEGYEICAPFGLHDLLAGIIRPNKVQVTQAIYEAKAARWTACWPHLQAVCWESV